MPGFFAWNLCNCANWTISSKLDHISSCFPQAINISIWYLWAKSLYILATSHLLKKMSQKHYKRRNKRKKNPFWCVLLQSTACPPRPPLNSANECPDVGVWAEPRPRRGSGSVAASLQQEDRLLGFVWWMWMSSITSFRDVDGYLDVATFPLSHPEAPSRHR